ncbi:MULTISPECIES: PucR family transcriptional regulator [Pseudonocardia]|uniref:Purine catabolism regulatory protein n=2 Tax=Pseudonocardia TaxID=1847 RepID=A0A1Y2MJC7_PSEAH|nr:MULTISPECIES: helix-turn-helix domain-containing protein [Pseudonocardia]OSY34767.1 Purine catabolism regulatory protein [Pseudonocardia autotrophica]TDN76095.1 PucR-like helix-turn-helix protein [Pseudonocardia autotrophica]BBG00074.1 hypothetical protein Pdca_12830 [Pseudonocardia autotrophica]GEC26039.1 hypothetical protein PSA01_30680 [Pseudonocardia saturnea]
MHENLQVLADQLAADLGRSVLIEDLSRLLAASALLGVVDQSRKDSILMRRPDDSVKPLHRRHRIDDAREPVLVAADEELGTLARWCIPLRTDVLHGFIWLIDEPPLSPDELEHARSAGARALEVLTRRRQHEARTGRLLDELLTAEEPARQEAAAALLEHGPLADDPPFTLTVVRAGRGDDLAAGDLESVGARLRERMPPAAMVSAVGDGHLVAVLTTTGTANSGASVEGTLADALRDGTPNLVVGTGAPAPTLAAVPEQLANARYAALVAASAPEFGGGAAWEQLGSWTLLQHVDHTEAGVERLCRGAGVLLDPRNEMYRETIETYLGTCGDARETALRLHIHRTTLYWRLNRAEQLLGRSLGDANVRIDLQLALRLGALLPR